MRANPIRRVGCADRPGELKFGFLEMPASGLKGGDRREKGAVSLQHQEVARGQRRQAVDGGELDRRAGAGAVGIEPQRALGLVVDDPVVGIPPPRCR